MEATVFNPAQMRLIDMMSFVKSPESLESLQQVISDYFANETQKEIDGLWATGELNDEKIESFRHLHQRTAYN